MKIIIVSYYSGPEITPRAFRTNSLYESLLRMGHEVELIVPTKAAKKFSRESKKKSYGFKKIMRSMVEFFLPGGKDLRYFFQLVNSLKNKNADLVISIGLPFSVHLSVSVSKMFFGLDSEKIFFDYGDPYSGNPKGCSCFYSRSIEFWALKSCDVIFTPIQEAIPSFLPVMPDNCEIRVLSQGYKIRNVLIKKYNQNEIVTFVYAGLFYKGIREPSFFLKYLSEIEADYRFIVYTDLNNSESLAIIERYKKLMGKRLVINSMIEREKCIEALSQSDFLINFLNEGGVQQPSKVVDYVLSKRPFLNISNQQNDFSIFEDFFDFDFTSFVAPDISDFDEDVVANKVVKTYIEQVANASS